MNIKVIRKNTKPYLFTRKGLFKPLLPAFVFIFCGTESTNLVPQVIIPHSFSFSHCCLGDCADNAIIISLLYMTCCGMNLDKINEE